MEVDASVAAREQYQSSLNRFEEHAEAMLAAQSDQLYVDAAVIAILKRAIKAESEPWVPS